MRSVTSLLAMVVILLGIPAMADAKPKVAVTPIEGDESGDMRDAVADALDGGDLEVISTRVVTKAIDKLGFDEDLSEKQAKKVGAELEADAVIVARLSKFNDNKVLKFTIYVGGKKIRGFKVTFNNAKNPTFKSKLRDKMVDTIERGGNKGGGDDDEDDDDNKKKKNKRTASDDDDEDEDDDDNKKKKNKRTASDDEDEDEDEDDDEIDEAVRRVSPRTANRVAVRLDVGGSATNRLLQFTQRNDFPQGPRTYRNGMVGGARVEGELYPFAFLNPKSIASGFGFAGMYDKTLTLNFTTTLEPDVVVPGTQYAWSLGARFRVAFGKKPTSPTITLGGGIGRRVTKADRSGLMDPTSLDVPSTFYKLYDPGIAFRFPFTSFIALTIAGKAYLITDAGQIQQPQSYGQAKVFGGWAQGGLDITLGNRFGIRVVGELSQVGFSFVGNGELSNNRDLDPDSKDVGGAADRSFGFAATLAVLY